MNKFVQFLVFSVTVASFHRIAGAQRIGYIGPACAVTHDSLFLHGEFVRKMEPAELRTFYRRQGALQVRKQLQEALSKGAANVSANFQFLVDQQKIAHSSLSDLCGANLDDSVEIVLDKNCILRDCSLYSSAGAVVRPLTLAEKGRVKGIIIAGGGGKAMERAEGEKRKKRKRRVRRTEGSELIGGRNYLPTVGSEDVGHHSPHYDDIAGLISHFLNVNESVARRFLPMAESGHFLAKLNDNLLRALAEDSDGGKGRGEERANDRAENNSEYGGEGQFGQREIINRRRKFIPLRMKDEPIKRRERRDEEGGREEEEEKEENGRNGRDEKWLALADDGNGGDIPHLILGGQGEDGDGQRQNAEGYYGSAGAVVGSPPAEDPFVRHFLRQFATSQQMGPIVDPLNQRTAAQMPVQTMTGWPQQFGGEFEFGGGYHPTANLQQQQAAAPSKADSGQIQPGQMVEIGGQNYVAVPLSSVFAAAGFPQKIGMMPMAQQQGQVGKQISADGKWAAESGGKGLTTTFQLQQPQFTEGDVNDKINDNAEIVERNM